MKKRSVGVTVFAVLFIVGGLLGLVSVMAFPQLLRAALETPGMTPENQAQLKTALTVFESRIGLMVAQSVGGLAASIGLLMLQLWAWWLTLILVGVSVLFTVIGLVSQGGLGQGPGLVGVIVGLLFALGWNVFIVWFFLRPSVKEQFVRTSG